MALSLVGILAPVLYGLFVVVLLFVEGYVAVEAVSS